MLSCRWAVTTPLNFTGTSLGVSANSARQPDQQRLLSAEGALRASCRACLSVVSLPRPDCPEFPDHPFPAPTTSPLSPGPNAIVPSPSLQPSYPGIASASADSTPKPPPSGAAALRHPPSSSLPFAPLGYAQPPFRTAQSPFRSRAATTLQRPLRRLSAARLWNPTNSTPRSTASSSHRNQPRLQRPPRPQPHSSSAAFVPPPARRRAPSTPLPPAVALSHPVLHDTQPVADDDPIGTGAGDYPLLTLPEQRQVRHSTSTRASLQVERAGSENRVSLPKSVRHSYDGKRLAASAASTPTPAEATDIDPDREAEAEAKATFGAQVVVGANTAPPPKITAEAADRTTSATAQPFSDHFSTAVAGPSSAPDPGPKTTGVRRPGHSAIKSQIEAQSHHPEHNRLPRPNTTAAPGSGGPFGLVFAATRPAKLDKGKGKMAAIETDHAANTRRSYSKDLERGPDILSSDGGGSGVNKEDHTHRNSTVSIPDGIGIGSAISSSNSSIMGDPEAQPNAGEEWGPQHPCFPHRNPHVPMDSPEYVTTRIIRIRRDWLIAGDLAPTFSNLYPEILDPAGMPEQEFRRVVDKLNKELCGIFEPWKVHNIIDGVLGFLTGWLWEDIGMTTAKRRLAYLERWIERWNESMASGTTGSRSGLVDDGPIPPKIIPLRETGYMTLDIQIGDPEIAPAPASTVASRAGQTFEEASLS